MAASSATGWIVPVSLFASITLTRAVSGRSAARRSAGETRPSRSTGRIVRAWPRRSRARHVASTAGCSTALVTRCAGCSIAPPNRPKIARLQASEPPDVKTSRRAVQWSSRASVRRADSTASRARVPAAWMLDGLPQPSSRAATIARTTSGAAGVVAFASR